MASKLETALIVGNGGRENAIAWKLKQSPHREVFMTRPNPGGEQWAKSVDVDIKDIGALQDTAKRIEADLVIFGPEAPLVAGGVDAMRKANINAWGPTEYAARLEGSKRFSQALADNLGIPQPESFVPGNFREAMDFVLNPRWKEIVIKADGLASGKGVFLPDSPGEAREVVTNLMQKEALEGAGKKILIQERLHGPEDSLIAFVAGNIVIPFPLARDHKRLMDGDKGPNTGGMGAVIEPNSIPSKDLVDMFIGKTARFMAESGQPYYGWLYAGIMHSRERGDVLLEYNVRDGDPEAQVHMRVMKSDLYEVILRGLMNHLKPEDVVFNNRAASAVVMAAEGYPDKPRAGDLIQGLRKKFENDIVIFQAGTKKDGNNVVTSEGRVLTATATGKDLNEALGRSYSAVDQIQFQGAQYRRDIGKSNT